MRRHRTTARGALFLLILGALSTGAASASTRGIDPPATPAASSAIVFPVVGPATYGDSYGDPRVNGSHAGIDIMTTWRSAAVAAEAGRVKFWTTSARAGCMLYLYGESGTTYLYIHLNNDRTAKRDNRGKCVPGGSYAHGIVDGARVQAGQQIGYNGDSGDAEGTYHLHFEVHPHDGTDVNPLPFLNAGTRLLFPAPAARPGRTLVLGLRGTPISAGGGVLEVSVTAVRVWPGMRWVAITPRAVELTVPDLAEIDSRVAAEVQSPRRRRLASRTTPVLTVFTTPVRATPEVLRGDAGSLSVNRVVLAGGPGGLGGTGGTGGTGEARLAPTGRP